MGEIMTCTEKDGVYTADLDLTKAYPMLEKYVRHLVMDEKACTLTVIDDVYAKEPVQIDWLLHSLSEPVKNEKGNVVIERKGVRLDVYPQTGLDVHAVINDQFGVDVNEGEPAMNQQRFGLPNPCTCTGVCADCLTETSICNQILITRNCKPAGRIKFVLVGEELGF